MSRRSRRQQQKRPARRVWRPMLEQVESRLLLTVSATYNSDFNILDVTADADGDNVIVSHNGEFVLINDTQIPAENESDEFARLSNTALLRINADEDEDEANDIRVIGVFPNTTFIIHAGGGNDVLVGGDGAENLFGGAGDDEIFGGGGDDLLSGEGGIDTLVGNDGDDKLLGGPDADQLFGDDGDDEILGGDGNDQLQGGNGNDTLEGESGNDVLFGQAGDDILKGGLGDDGFVFEGSNLGIDSAIEIMDEGKDYLDFGLFSGPVDVNLTETTQQPMNADNLILTLSNAASFEIVVGSSSDDTITGNGLDNFLFGNGGHDTISGSDGDDMLFGQVGDDELRGDGGDDVLIGGAGNDIQRGGLGNDIYQFDAEAAGHDTITDRPTEAPCSDLDFLDFSESPEGIIVSLSTVTAQPVNSANTLTLTSGTMIEGVFGSNHNDTIRGNSCDNDLEGSKGDDTLSGKEGDDMLVGGDDKDTLLGGEGDDTLKGDAGIDTLRGDDGNDFLQGGPDQDTYVFDQDASGHDAVADLETDLACTNSDLDELERDQLDFSAFPVGITVDLQTATEQSVGANLSLSIVSTIEDIIGTNHNDFLVGNDCRNLLEGKDGDDYLDGKAANDTLRGGLKNDTLVASQDDDTLQGDVGQDTYEFDVNWGDDEIVETSDGGADTLKFSAVDTSLTYEIGSDLVVADNQGNRATNQGNQIETLLGGTASDSFVFSDGAELGGGLGSIVGAEGGDTLDYSEYTTPVAVNRRDSSSTGISQFQGIEAFVGGQSGADLLVGVHESTTWNITDENEGNIDGVLSFSSFETVSAGNQDDQFVLTTQFSVLTGLVNGGDGNDALNTQSSHDLDLADREFGRTPFESIESFSGASDRPNRLKGADHENDWVLMDTRAGHISNDIDGSIEFSQFESFFGGDGVDRFLVNDGVLAVDTIWGGDGNDAILLAAYSGDISVSLSASLIRQGTDPFNKIIQSFESIELFVGGTAKNEVFGEDTGTEWRITNPEHFLVDGRIVFDRFGVISAGDGDDHFVMTPTGHLSRVSGGEGLDLLDYSSFGDGVRVDFKEGTATGIDGLSEVNVAHGGHGQDTLIADPNGNLSILVGNDGHDEFFVGSGHSLLSGGSGNDKYHISPADTASVIDISDSDGIDQLNFSESPRGVTIAADVTAAQSFTSRGDRIEIRDTIENFIGSGHQDEFHLKPSTVPRFVDGRGQGGGEADMLTVDADGNAATKRPTTIAVDGFADIAYARIESATVVNAAATASTDAEGNVNIKDASGQNNNVTVKKGSIRIATETNPITVDTDLGTQVSPTEITVPTENIAGGSVICDLQSGDDTLTIDLRDGELGKSIVYNAGTGDDSLIIDGDGSALGLDWFDFTYDGGDGANALLIVGGGFDLDLTQLATGTVTGVDIVDIAGSSGSKLELNEESVRNLASAGTLRVNSDERTTVDIGTGWTFVATEVVDDAFVRVLAQGEVTLKLDGPYDWSYPENSLDASGSGSVEPLDALLVINELNDPQFSDDRTGRLTEATSVEVFPNRFFDAHPDGFVTPIDALVIINFVNDHVAVGEGESRLGWLPTDTVDAHSNVTTASHPAQVKSLAEESRRTKALTVRPSVQMAVDAGRLLCQRKSRASQAGEADLLHAIDCFFADHGSAAIWTGD